MRLVSFGWLATITLAVGLNAHSGGSPFLVMSSIPICACGQASVLLMLQETNFNSFLGNNPVFGVLALVATHVLTLVGVVLSPFGHYDGDHGWSHAGVVAEAATVWATWHLRGVFLGVRSLYRVEDEGADRGHIWLPNEYTALIGSGWSLGFAVFFFLEAARARWVAGLACGLVCLGGFLYPMWLLTARSGLSARPGLLGRLACRRAYLSPWMRTCLGTAVWCLCICVAKVVQHLCPPRGVPTHPAIARAFLVQGVVPMALALALRGRVIGRLADTAERRHRLLDGANIAAMQAAMQVSLVRPGAAWWVPVPDADVEDGALLDLASGATAPTRFEMLNRAWVEGRVVEIKSDMSFTIDPTWHVPMPPSVRQAGLVRARLMAHPNAMLSPDELLTNGLHSLYGAPFSRVLEELLLAPRTCSAWRPDLAFERAPCRAHEIDLYVSHSWHDDPPTKLEALRACVRCFERDNGRPPTLWLDKICVHPAFAEESLVCMPVHLHACRGVLVLCGPTYFTRLWCAWELYTLFAFTGRMPELMYATIRGPHDYSKVGFEELRRRFESFRLADAHCRCPNDEVLLRATIESLPGGAAGFQTTIRNLSGRFSCALSADGFEVPGQMPQRMEEVGMHMQSDDGEQELEHIHLLSKKKKKNR